MGEGFWSLLLIVVVVVVYVAAEVVFYMRKSARQWREVDRSKLRKWEDEDDE